jgi:hypothetical protein
LQLIFLLNQPKQKMETEKDACPVCLEEGEDDKEELTTLTPCGHAMHKSCMLGWIRMNNNLCPLCRSPATAFHDGEKIANYPMIGASPDGDFVIEVVREYPRLSDAVSWDEIPPSFWGEDRPGIWSCAMHQDVSGDIRSD